MYINEIVPTIEYDDYEFRNIFFKYFLSTDIEDKYLQVYRLSDGETLEDVSYNMYGDPIYFWTIMIINGFRDPIFDIAVSENTLQNMARDLSYVDGELDESLYLANYDELTEQNATKREIKVIKNAYLNKFLTELIRQYENNI